MPKTYKLFLDQSFITADKGMVEHYAPWNLNGRGVFETMRVHKGKITFLKDHIERLQKGLDQQNVQSPFSTPKLKTWLEQTLKENKTQEARLRLIVWQEDQGYHISIAAMPYRPLDEKVYQRGFSAGISDIRRVAGSVHSKTKSIRYQPMLTAYLAAQAQGYDEAIMLNEKGDIAEGSRSNLFIIHKGTLKTPPLKSGCLDGITRQLVLELARKQGIPVKVEALKPKDLKGAEEAFLTNSLLAIMPLTRFEGGAIGTGSAGALTTQLREAIKIDLND